MVEIPLDRGMVALVDEEDLKLISGYKWYSSKNKRTHYAKARHVNEQGKTTTVRMHRLILGLSFYDKRQGDHINLDGLDNRRQNLRICSSKENSRNRRLKILEGKTSRFKGVSRDKEKWRASIMLNGKNIHLGAFFTEEDAALAYDKGAIKYFGSFAHVNFKN